MNCANCGATNAAGSRFCEQCGGPLDLACRSCGGPIGATARFCRSCGTPVLATPSATTSAATAPTTRADATGPEAATTERRLVSVLFADLVGFTTLAEDRDPEYTRELLNRYFDAARDAIERHGGTVEKFIGDAVMAVWGTPVAREDDAERAVRAALELVGSVPSLAPQLQARAGVLTGEAAVTIGATNQGMVAGDLVNTAARLQGVAEPGTVLVGEPTMRAADRAIVFEPIGEHSLKGKTAPVAAWRAVRVVAALGGQQRADALEPPFVGRDEELRLLKEQAHATGRDQRARLISIIGPGGIGKSRLVWEFEKYLDGLTELMRWHRGRSPSYGEGITFWALGEMVRRRCELTEEDDEETTRARVSATVAEYVTDPAERQIVEPALLALLGVEEPAVAGRDALFPAWRLFFERISETATTVLVFEDLQWADTGLLDFIDHLLEWSKSRPILVVTLSRPELFERRPDWGAGHRTVTALALDPLTDDAMRQLLAGVVPGLPESAVATIVERAEGMPLYAVETVRSLLAEGRIEREGEAFRPVGDLSELSIPDSLRSLIASRLDALDPADRVLLQDASVLGQAFTAGMLAAVTGQEVADVESPLRSMVRRELLEVESDPLSPERGQYKFVQALIREVAYGTLALRDRRTRHLAAARHYESLGDDALAGALASHYVSAYEASAEGQEADAVAAQARIALRAAADRAARLGAHEQAVAFVERALDITNDPRERADLLERATRSAIDGAIGDPDAYARAVLAAREEIGEPDAIYRAIALLGKVLLDLTDVDPALAVLEQARTRPDWPPAPEIEAEVLVVLSRAYMRSYRTADALAAADRTLEIAEPLNLVRIIADGMNNRAASLSSVGRRREATALMEAAVSLAAEGGWVDLQLRLLNNLAVSVADDDPARATQISRDILTIAERVGNVQWYLIGASASSSADYEELRDFDGALRLALEAHARAPKGSWPWIQVTSSAVTLLAATGQPADALAADVDAAAQDGPQRFWADMTLVDVALAEGDYARVERYSHKALETRHADSNEPLIRSGLVYAVAAQGRAADARREADALGEGRFQGPMSQALTAAADAAALALEGAKPDARRRFTEAFDVFRRLDQLLFLARWQIVAVALLSDAPEADAWAAESRELFERAGAKAYLARLDETLAARPTSAPRQPAPSLETEAPSTA